MVAIFTGLGAGFERGSAAALGGGGLLGSSSLGRGGEGVFLNAASGNLVLTRQDEFLVGRGPDIAIARTYNSLGALDDNGDYWRQSTDRRVFGLTGAVNTAGSTVTRVSADGSEIVYAWNGTHYAATDGAGARDKLAYAGNVWTWTDGASRIGETYAAHDNGTWRITAQQDLDGNTLTFAYVAGAPDKLEKVTTADGSYTKYAWSGANIARVETWYAAAGAGSPTQQLTRTYYAYDAQNRLTQVTVDLSPEDNSTSDGKVYTTSYTYHGASNRIATIAQTDGSSLSIGYDGSNRVSQMVQTVASGDARTTTIAYFPDRTEVTDPRGEVSKLYYDAAGQLTSIVAPPAQTGAAAQTVSFLYDGAGNLTRLTDAAGGETNYVYDANGNLIQITDANGTVTTRTYDANNSLTLETRTGSYSGGALTSLYTRYVYDSENHLRYAISAEGRVSEYRYTGAGELEWTISYPAHAYAIGASVPSEAAMDAWRDGLADRSTAQIAKYVYDGRGNLKETWRYGSATSAGVAATGEGYAQSNFVYDQAGQLLSRYTIPHVAETFVYDGMGRLTLSTDLAGGTTTIVFDDANTKTTVTAASGYTTVSTYNKAGELISRADSGADTTGGTSLYLHDKNGQLRMATDATLRKSYFLYDKTGRKIADIGQDGQVVEYRYDGANRLVATARYQNKLTSTQLTTLADPNSETEIASIRPAAHSYDIWQWSVYDAGGRAIETIMGDGSVTTYEYDQAGRLVKTLGFANKLSSGQISGFMTAAPSALVLPTADSGRDVVIRSFYDRDGRVIGALNAEGALSRVLYDSAGRKIQEIAYANLTNPSLRASGTFDQLLASFSADAAKDVSARYVYDGQGLLRFAIDALNRVTEYVYRQVTNSHANGLVRRTNVFATPLVALPDYSYATVKAAVAGLASANDRYSYAIYNDRGQLAYAIDATNAVTGFVYDSSGRVVRTTQFATPIAMGTRPPDSALWLSWADTWAASNGAGARITRNYYAARGEARFVVDAEGYVTQNDYDAEGRLRDQYRYANKIAVTDASSIDTVNSAAKGSSILVKYRYDNLGRLQDVYDGADVRRSKIYYGNGALGYEIVAYGQGMDKQRVQYFYDQAGKLTTSRRWTSETTNATSLGGTATLLTQAQRVVSANGQYSAVLTREGELRLYHKGELIWTNGVRETVSGATYRLVAQTDGNLVIYRDVSGQAQVGIWSSNTAGAHSGATFLKMQDDGNLTFNKGTAPTSTGVIWSTGTTSVVAQDPNASEYLDTVTTYDGLGNIASVRDARGNTTNFTYDKAGRVLTQTNPLSGVTTFQYDTFGRGVKTTDARGNASFAYFDQAGRVTLAIDAEGYATETSYTPFSEIASLKRRYVKTTGAAVGVPPSLTANALDATTSFEYDKLGRVTKTTDAEGAYEQYTLNAFGQRKEVRNKLGGVTLYAFDMIGRTVTETLPINSVRADGTVQAANVVNKYEYDSRGNLTKKIEAYGLTEQRTTIYAYDSANRLIGTTGDALSIAAASIAALTNVTPSELFFYDRRGNLIEKRDAIGARTLYWYDKLDRLTHTLSASGTLTRSFYDKMSNVVETRVYATQLALPADAKGLPPTGSGASRSTLFVYDALNRMTQAKTANVRTALYTTSLAVSGPTDLVTTYEYDAMGNVVRVTDANGKQTWCYYDKLGRKLVQIDAANYRTDWIYNSDANVLSERRYKTASAAPASTSAPPTTPTTSTDDRVTNFTYDRMGRRLTETRLGVSVHNGSGAQATADATIGYQYNGLGEVARKTEASGDFIQYAYDVGGRMTSEQRSGFIDVNGASVTPRIEYSYNGLNDLARTRALGAGGTIAAADRVTTYAYGAGGRLLSVTDASGFVRTYRYDAAGRVTREEYVRVKPDGSLANEAAGYDYDLEGRVTRQGIVLKPGGAWMRDGATIDTVATLYNAFGEVSKRGFAHYASGAETVLYGEEFHYDQAGRLERTNAGDGVWKYFMYDKAGNQTLMLATVGADFAAASLDTLSEVLALWDDPLVTGPNYDRIATANVVGVVATITKYDARNQAIEVIEPMREVHVVGVLTPSALRTARAYNAFGEVIRETNANGFDASGNVIASASVEYAYNTMGRLIQTTSPAVSITGENGAVTANYRPVEHGYYDVSGRLVAQRDANNYLTRYTLLAGTGYGGSQALIAETFTPDGAVTRTKYDIHGDARRIEDGLYLATAPTLHVTTQNFDAMGRLVQMTRAASLTQALTDYYRYDGLGQRIRHFNSFYNPTYNPIADPTGANAANAATTTYDHQGRITQVVVPGGDTTKYAYAWDGTLLTKGMNSVDGLSGTPFCGWAKTTTFANGKALTEKNDVFGREVGKIDMSAHTTHFTYDKAGRLIQRNATYVPVVGGPTVAWDHTLHQTYFNTGRLSSLHYLTGNVPAGNWSEQRTTFGYDKLGNVAAQKHIIDGEHTYWTEEGWVDEYGNPIPPLQAPGPNDTYNPGGWQTDQIHRVVSNQAATFDALGRIVSWSESSSEMPAATHNFFYDANGNIRRSFATYRALNAHGAIATSDTTQDYWYKYDAMNRMVTSKGVFTGAVGTGSIGRGTSGGVDTFYNLDGTRAYTLTGQAPFNNPWREQYVYDAVGKVLEVKAGSNLTAEPTARVGLFTYDALSRLLTQGDWHGTSGYLGGGQTYSRTVTYNAKNQIVSDDSTVHHSDNAYRELSTYDYGDIVLNPDGSVNVADTDYALGSALQVDVKRWKDNNDGADPDKRTKNTYHWYDGAVAATIKHAPSVNLNDPNWETNSTLWTTTYFHDLIGGQALLKSASIQDGHPRGVTWTNDLLGQVVRRDEQDNQSGGDPHEVWHRFSGRQMGYVGNNGNYDVGYAATRGFRQSPGSPGPGSFADFDLAHDHINSYTQGSSGGVYTVRSGDTLQGIAAALWGDASLWYKIAEVNGLTASSTLIEGQQLLIPVGVQRNENNAATYQPYDPLEVLGNTSPTSPKPPKAGGCGAGGLIILAIIAIVVVAIIAPYAMAAMANLAPGVQGVTAAAVSKAMAAGVAVSTAGVGTTAAVAGGAIAGAAGSIISQGVGVATGIQDKFSWNAVALAAIGGGVGASGFGGAVARTLGAAKGGWTQTAISAMANNALTQGIGKAIGAQDKFSWAGVAAAGMGALAFRAVAGIGESREMIGPKGPYTERLPSNWNALAPYAQMIADAGARSLIEGSDFGDNIVAALPNVIGQTIGEAIAGGLARVGARESVVEEAIAQVPVDETGAPKPAAKLNQHDETEQVLRLIEDRAADREAQEGIILAQVMPREQPDVDYRTESLLDLLERLPPPDEPQVVIDAVPIIWVPELPVVETQTFYVNEYFDVYYAKAGPGGMDLVAEQERINPSRFGRPESTRGGGVRYWGRAQISRPRGATSSTSSAGAIDPGMIIVTSEVVFRHTITPMDEFGDPIGDTRRGEERQLYVTRIDDVRHFRVTVPGGGLVRAWGLTSPYTPGMQIYIDPH